MPLQMESPILPALLTLIGLLVIRLQFHDFIRLCEDESAPM